MEITSKSTASEDGGTKKGLYAYLGVKEYFQYDPTADYLKPPLQGFRLVEGNYLPIPGHEINDCLSLVSEVLGLELHLETDGEMRFYSLETREKLLSPKEMEHAKCQAEQAQYEAEQRANKLADKLRELGIDPDSV